jgi:hypothetical protein
LTKQDAARKIAKGAGNRTGARMTFTKSLIALSSAILLTGCGVSATSYATSKEALRGSPALRSEFVANCTRNIKAKPLRTRQNIAKVMNTSVGATPRTYCSRLTRGITSGRLSHKDISAASRGQVTPAIVRVLQGR